MTSRKIMTLSVLLLLVAGVLAACGDNAAGSEDTDAESVHPAEQAVLDYLTARVNTDEEALRAVICPDLEAQVPIQLNSFRGRNASLENVSCTFDGEETADCTGDIATEYEGETDTRPVGNYRVIEDDGVWKVCGEAE